jgi:hypothetical protein
MFATRRVLVLAFAAISAAPGVAQPDVVSTIVGGGLLRRCHERRASEWERPRALRRTRRGNVYFSAHDSILKLDLSGRLTQIAGSVEHLAPWLRLAQ